MLPALATAQVGGPIASRQQAVEQGLIPAIIVEGETGPAYTIYERMAHYGVPGVSIAVINGGHIEWAAGYGVQKAGGTDSVTVSTLFQAASISKPVTALAALQLVEQGKLTLDGAVNPWLRSWKIPANHHTAAQPVTLRHLLSHTAGTTVGGFPGYGLEADIPSPEDILNGLGNTGPVLVDTLPGSIFRYSGGGYTIVQVLIQQMTGRPFSAALAAMVLQPLGMYRSTFAQPLPPRLAKEAARGHHKDGTIVAGGWHVYPELAAAGLWTTPSDLARFALGVRAAYLGGGCGPLEQATAQEMLTVQQGGYGLGPGLGGEGDSLLFAHPGGNAGYRAFMLLHPVRGDGVAVMANADRGGGLNMELVRAVSHVYHWPFFKPEVRTAIHLPEAALEKLAGRYRTEERPVRIITVECHGNRLYLTLPEEGAPQRRRLFPISATEFFGEDTGLTVVFNLDGHEQGLTVQDLRARLIE